ncbi:SigB/SigF/SigG family RNA polymerase sigma factor [Pseudonocardia abyssalis]|uniref:SigB/SigF/SigG family RNA polymerase sigma factor n=1 Tax=Pseudonocardia abyssalis TaxID=2792008 RepID=A0ABS6UYE7_9PSEU|nr:SigB/SigF/SigG family RNA polymerase sigma factor [Pseudonocardia abyssalis]MBW0116735.1 SigB/SigF/SigG family RNA polymerase sigma factor [Pseudonocardia abyssalis]MBW0137241.1 SigB/SigF/SigG family RNA polymerase sigma factor [Pseudonocardia abyssalis]
MAPNRSGRRVDEYSDLRPLLARFAGLPTDDPLRRTLQEELVIGFLPVVQHIARRYRNSGEPSADLEQVGTIGLLGALKRYDPGTGKDFLSFAVPTITGEIKRHFRDRAWSMHVPRPVKDLHSRLPAAIQELSAATGRAPRPSQLAIHLGVDTEKVLEALHARHTDRSSSLDEHLSDSDTELGDVLGRPDPGFDLTDDRLGLRSALSVLPARDRYVVGLRFFDDLTQTQIAERIGVSQMHVSRILARSLAVLRRSPAFDHADSHDGTATATCPGDGPHSPVVPNRCRGPSGRAAR